MRLNGRSCVTDCLPEGKYSVEQGLPAGLDLRQGWGVSRKDDRPFSTGRGPVIASRLEFLMKRSGLSGRGFAELAGLDERAFNVCMQRAKDGKGFTAGTLFKIAEAGDVPPGSILACKNSTPLRLAIADWPKVVTECMARYPLVPDYALDLVGDVCWPEAAIPQGKAVFLRWLADVALGWFNAANDRIRERAEDAFVDRKRAQRAGALEVPADGAAGVATTEQANGGGSRDAEESDDEDV